MTGCVQPEGRLSACGAHSSLANGVVDDDFVGARLFDAGQDLDEVVVRGFSVHVNGHDEFRVFVDSPATPLESSCAGTNGGRSSLTNPTAATA